MINAKFGSIVLAWDLKSLIYQITTIVKNVNLTITNSFEQTVEGKKKHCLRSINLQIAILRSKRQYVDSERAKAPKKRMTLNSREASMSLEDILAVRNALEMYEAKDDDDDITEEPPSSTVSSVGHEETPILGKITTFETAKQELTIFL